MTVTSIKEMVYIHVYVKHYLSQPINSTLRKYLTIEMFAFIFRFIFLLTLCFASDNNFLHLFEQYCAESLKCQLETQRDSNLTETKTNKCCGECSCEENCGQTQSCCFAEDNVRYSKTHGKECIDPYTGDEVQFQQVGSQGIVMVTHCLDKNQECKFKNGTLNVNPVESSSSEVFINKDCAMCNGVSSFVRWKARILSSGTLLYPYQNIEDPRVNTETVIFEPPTTFLYPKCHSTFIKVDISKCPDELYKQACLSVVLPFITLKGAYQNIFCFLCIESYKSSCSPKMDRTAPGTMSLLLDSALDTTNIAAYFSREHKKLTNKEHCQEGYMPHPSRVWALYAKLKTFDLTCWPINHKERFLQ